MTNPVDMRREPMHRRTLHVLPVVATTGALVLALAGCGGSSGTSASSGTSTASTSTTSTTPSSTMSSPTGSASSTQVSDSSSSDESSSQSSVSATTTCRSSQLTARLGRADGAAGSVYVPIVLTNTGSTCAIKGYPGVSLVRSGSQIGAAAERDASVSPTRIVLAAGRSATATLRITQTGNFDTTTCQPRKATAIRVYPPDQTSAIDIATTAYTGCASTKLSILTITALKADES